MKPELRPSLPLDVSRQELLQAATSIIAKAWQSFDHARDTEPEIATEIVELAKRSLQETPTSAIEALNEAATTLDASLAQSRPRFFAFVGSSGLEVGVLADALASAFDVNLAVSGRAADLIEHQALAWVAELVGFPFGAGSFTSGGMVSNLTALVAAREQAMPEARQTGLAGKQMALYCSAEAHYSVRRAAEVLGIGANNVRSLAIDKNRRINPNDVAAAIDDDLKNNIMPVAVIATAGTTLTGAVDPINALADVCESRNVWLHVDGAYGLPAAAVPEYKHLFSGLRRADSVSIDAHKWLFLPKACGVVLVKHGRTLSAAFSHQENYMLHDNDTHALNPVDQTLEYSRPFRALKLWLALRVHGAKQFRAALKRNLEEAQYCTVLVRQNQDLELLAEPQLSVVPFRHVPKSLRGQEDKLNLHNTELVKRMQEDGRVFVSSAMVDEKVCLRPCFVNFRTTKEDVRALIEITLELGDALA